MIYVLAALAGLVTGIIVATIYFREDNMFYRRLASERGMMVVELRSEVSHLKKKLGEPEDLIYG